MGYLLEKNIVMKFMISFPGSPMNRTYEQSSRWMPS